MYRPEQIERLVNRFAEARQIAESTVCKKACRNGSVMDRLHSGRVTLRTIDRLLQYLSDNWPNGLIWYEDIPRPEPTVKEGVEV